MGPQRSPQTLAAVAIAVVLGLAPPSRAQAPQEAAEPSWLTSVEIGVGARLDLATLLVVDPMDDAGGAHIDLQFVTAKVQDPLHGRAAIALSGDVRLVTWREGPARLVASRLVRPFGPGSGGAPARPPLEIGAEIVALPGSGDEGPWAYLRVLDVSPKTVRLEVARATSDLLVRDPVALTAEAEPRGHRLQWSSTDGADGSFAVARRIADVDEPGPWERIGITDDTTFLDAEPPAGRVAEYRVVRLAADGAFAPDVMGSVCRAVRMDTPGEWPLEVGVGARVDLVTGAVVSAQEPAHVEVGRSSPGSLALRPLEGTRFALDGKSARLPDASDWWVPPIGDRRYVPSRTSVLRNDGEVEFVLPGGLVGRLRAYGGSGERWELERQISIDGDRLLPRPPGPPVEMRVDAATARITFPPVDPASGVDPSFVALVLEREVAYGREDWTVAAEFPPGKRTVALDALFVRGSVDPLEGPAPVARLRVRQRIAFGPQSHPSEPFDVLAAADEASRRELLESAVADLVADEFQRRVEARAVLRALGDDARAALEAVALGDLGVRGNAARAVLESIERGDGTGRGLARSLRRRALDLARSTPGATGRAGVDDLETWLGDVPRDLHAGGAAERAHGLLVLVDRAERGLGRGPDAPPGDVGEDCVRARIWASAVAATDDDAGVRWLARYLAELGPRPSLASFEADAPYFLMDPAERPALDGSQGLVGSTAADDPLTLLSRATWMELPASAEELAWQLERRPELADLDLGPPLARLLHALRRASSAEAPDVRDDRFFDYDARATELVLRLVARARGGPGRRALLDAAAALLPGVDLDLASHREVSDRRLASPSADAIQRRTITLEAADLDLLEGLLGDLASDGLGDAVDVLLPAGVYESTAETHASQLDVRRSDLRLRPADPGAAVEIRVGIRVRDARNVVLEGIRIRNDAGSALSVHEECHAVALRARLSGAGNAVQVQSGDLELYECVVDGADLAKAPQWCVRQLGTGRLLARATRFDAGTLFLSDEGRTWLDRCVVDAGQRTLVQAQRVGTLTARETLFRGENLGLYNVAHGVLAAVVIDVPRDPLGRRPVGLRVSPRYFHLVGEGQSVPSSMKLRTEPFDRR